MRLYGLKASLMLEVELRSKKPSVTPQPPPRRMKGVRNYTGTLYLLFQTLVVPSLITESKYHIQRYKKNKTTTVVVFTVSIHTIMSPIYIYIYKNCTFT